MRNGRFNPSKCRGKVQKMGVLYIHSPKTSRPILKLPHNTKHKSGKSKNYKKKGASKKAAHSLSNCGPRLASDRWLPTARGCPKLAPSKIFLLPPAHIFLRMWSTLAGWLQHMPTLPRLLLKFSKIHNF
jgi:hypothetical protein